MNNFQWLRKIGINVTVALTSVAAASGPALAQKYPTDRVTIVVPYSPGNGLDLLGREFAEALQPLLGVPVIVENREGAAGVIGTSSASRAKPDGYTLLFTAHPPFAIAPAAMDNPPYNPITSFLPIARVGSVPLVLVTANSSPFKTFEQLKEFAKKNPEKASYASAGIGSPGQLYGELLNQATDLKLQEVPYKATGQALTDVISGNVLVSLVSVTAAAQHIKSGTLVPIAMGSRQRLADFPDVPTLAEVLGQKNFQASVWYGFFAPVGLPKDRLERLNAEITKAANSKKVGDFMARSTMVLELQNPTEFASSLTADAETARKLVQGAKLKGR